jgi:lysozyme|tara:strand:- start:2630 stop:3043 length:414 start_codon:yes stop_codon:yes gene_type:complete
MNLKRLKESIKKEEGYKSHVYQCSMGYDTIGYGTTIKDMELDESLADILLEREITRKMIQAYNRFSWLCKQPAAIQEVVIDVCYNIGVTGFSKFVKTIEFIKQGEYIMAGDELLDSRYARQVPNRAKRNSLKLKGVK